MRRSVSRASSPLSSQVSGTKPCCAHAASSGTQIGDRRRLDPDLQPVDRLLVAAVELVGHLAVELDPDLLAPSSSARTASGRRCPTAVRTSARVHCVTPLAVITPSSSEPVVGAGVVERLDAAEDLADVADEDAAGLAVEPALAVDLDPGPERLQPEVLGAGPHVGGTPEPVLERAGRRRGSSSASSPVPAITAKRSPLTRPDVDRAAARRAAPTSTACCEVVRDAEVAGEQVAGAGGQDRQRDRRRRRPRRCSAAPCRRRPTRTAGRRPRRSPRARTSARTCSSAPRTRAGRRRPASASTLAQLGQATAERLAARARPPRPRSSHRLLGSASVVAGAVDVSTRRSCALGQPGPDRDVPDRDATGADQGAADHVGRVVHAAVHPGRGDDDRRDDGEGDGDRRATSGCG